MNVKELMQVAPVIPVLVIDDVKHAVPLAEALVKGGLRVLEVTLRTPAALDAIKAMTGVDGAIVGVGTALDGNDIKNAAEHGATFAVSPGFTSEIGAAANKLSMPLLPGVMTSAEIMNARQHGFSELKFFPASQAGGTTMLKAFGGPFVDVSFCPTGGINANTAADYLSLNNVRCVGGSWVAPKNLVSAGDWDAITELATTAAQLPV